MEVFPMIETPAKSNFDAQNPPERELIEDCVHCGFCLPACPTYVLWGKEMDSPRGRIYMMKSANEGKSPLNEIFQTHMDNCLGCMACMTACPSGVQYNKLIEDTRAQVERNIPRTLTDSLFRRMLFASFPYPARLRLLAMPMRLYQKSGLQRLVRGSGLLKLLPKLVRQGKPSRSGRSLSGNSGQVVALDLAALDAVAAVVLLVDTPARDRVQRRGAQCLSGAQAEAGMVPGAAHGIADDQPLGERAAIVGAGRADGKKLAAAAREQHRLLPDMPAEHASVGNVVQRNALREIGPLRLGLLGHGFTSDRSTGTGGEPRTADQVPRRSML